MFGKGGPPRIGLEASQPICKLVGLYASLARMALAIHDEIRKRLRAPARPRPPELLTGQAAVFDSHSAKPAVEPAVEPTVEPAVEPTVEPAVEPAVEPIASPIDGIGQEIEDEIVVLKPVRRPLAPVLEWRHDARRPSYANRPIVDFNACCDHADHTDHADPPLEGLPDTLKIVLPTPETQNVLSAEESYLKDWYDESTKECAEEHLWIDGDKQDVSTVAFTQERLKEIGIDCGKTNQVNRLYWIQDKPEGFEDRFGHWDPVGARWRIFPNHNVVPVEQRIAPAGVGAKHTLNRTLTDTRVYKRIPVCSDRVILRRVSGVGVVRAGRAVAWGSRAVLRARGHVARARPSFGLHVIVLVRGLDLGDLRKDRLPLRLSLGLLLGLLLWR